MSFQYTITLSDPTNALTSQQASAALANLTGALDIYARHLTGSGVLDVVLQVDLSGRTVGSGASAAAATTGSLNGKTTLEEGAVHELRTGVDVNGSAGDIIIGMPPAYLANDLWLDPDPSTRSTPVQAGKFDAVSFFLHELGHALGFNGRGDGNTGIVSGQFLSTYDTLVATSGGFPVFTGANAVAAYGGPVPLSTGIVNSYTHYGRVTADGLDLGMMEGSTYAPAGVRWYLDVLDLAFFRDMGLTTVSSPIADAGGSRFQSFAGSDSLNGGIGADTLIGGAGNDQLLGAEGNDSLTDSSGTNYLRGGDGNDAIQGGTNFDDINGNQGNDTASGGLGDDWVVGGKDNDSLSGEAGSDVVYGNLGNDTGDGGSGDDIIRGGQGDDVLIGGTGDDWISGDRGNDTLTGGFGADTFNTFGDAGTDRVLDFSRADGDRVRLDPGSTYTVSQVGFDTVINVTGGAQLILVGVSQASLTGDWIFVG